MKHLKHYASIITMLMLLSQITFTSCSEDFGPDIDQLKEEISEIQVQLSELKEAYEAGKIITKVEPLQGTEPNSWKITFSDNSTIDILSGRDGTNGTNGADGVTPYLKINNEGNWIVSYNNTQTYEPLTDASGNPVCARGKDGANGVSVEVRVNEEGNYEIITYLDDKDNPLSVLSTPYNSNPSNQIASIVENSEQGTVVITMSSGAEYKFVQKIIYPTSIVVLTKEVIITEEGGTAEIEFRVNPSNAVITKADVAIDKITTKAYAESYVTVPENYEITNLIPAVNNKGETLQGQYTLTIKDRNGGLEYNDNCTLVITAKDSQDNKIQISSETFKIVKSFAEVTFPTEYHFENWAENRNTSGVYEDCYERLMGENGNTSDLYIWASGNLGYRITGNGPNPSDYPTYKTLSQNDAHNGAYAAVLETRYVGAIGQGSPLAAGNLFIGEFSGKGINIMKEQMKATRFGMPFNKKPKSLKVWFKYKSGGAISIYNESGDIIGTRTTDNDNSGNNQNIGNKDYAAIYAVMFDNVKAKELYNGKNYLDGSTILSSKAEVGRAILTDNDKYGTPTNEDDYPNEYVYKELPFTYSSSIDESRLKNYEYSIAIVFSSSYYGAEFQGAVGSKLWIDDVILECE